MLVFDRWVVVQAEEEVSKQVILQVYNERKNSYKGNV
jgi:hypothetical protein